jgi:mono/diheme cytochrome c family protein
LASVAAAAGLVLLVGPVGAGAQGEDGQAVFDRLCKGCHTIGGGDLAGPDLQGVADRRERAWVEAFVRDPAAVIESDDPIANELLGRYGAAMPTLGVSDAQLAALVAFLGFEQATPATPTETTSTETMPLPAGDEDEGKRLFEGSERFEEGGPACLSCHSVGGVGALGGGQLGPDLTGAFEKYGGARGLDGVLAAVAFPTMAPIFADRQLGEAERADLAAFLENAATEERVAGQAGKLVALALGVAALIALLALVVWRRRLAGVRRPLVDRAARRSA